MQIFRSQQQFESHHRDVFVHIVSFTRHSRHAFLTVEVIIDTDLIGGRGFLTILQTDYS